MKSILIILLSIAPTLAWTITPKVILLSPQLDYCKQYQNILEIPTNIIEWRLDATGEGKERATYFTQVHMTNHRSCGVVFNKADMSWDDIQTRRWSFDMKIWPAAIISKMKFTWTAKSMKIGYTFTVKYHR